MGTQFEDSQESHLEPLAHVEQFGVEEVLIFVLVDEIGDIGVDVGLGSAALETQLHRRVLQLTVAVTRSVASDLLEVLNWLLGGLRSCRCLCLP